MTRRTTGGALLAVLGLLLASAALIAPPSQAAPGDATIAATPNTGLGEFTVVSVSGNAGPLSTRPDTTYPALHISMCTLPLSASSCDTDLTNFGQPVTANPATSPHVVDVVPNASGNWGPINYLVRRTLVNGDGTFDCRAVQCVIGSANAPRPSDHSYDATQNLSFTTSTATATPTATTTVTPTATATPTATSTPTSTSSSGGLSITATPNSGLADGQTISVRGNAGKKNAPRLFVAVCSNTPTASNCDQDLTGIGTPTAHILQVTPNASTGAWGPVNFYVRRTIVTGDSPNGYNCLTHPTCVIGSTNAANPKDHTFNVTTPLTFKAGAVAPPPPAAATTPPADGSGSGGGSGSGSGDGSGDASGTGDTLAATGADAFTPLLAAVGLATILAGLIVIVANPRRRPTHR